MSDTDCYAPSAMAKQDPAQAEFQTGDPWIAFGYLVAGVAFYGLLGWLADRWLGTTFLVAVGILLGAGLGLFMTWSRFATKPATQQPVIPTSAKTQEKQ